MCRIDSLWVKCYCVDLCFFMQVPFVLQALQIFMEDRDVEAWRKQMQQDSQQRDVQESGGDRQGSERRPQSQGHETAISHKNDSAPPPTHHRGGDGDAFVDGEPEIDPAIRKSDLLLNEIAIMCQMCHHYTSSLLSSRLGPLLRDTKTTGKIFHELTAAAQQVRTVGIGFGGWLRVYACVAADP